MFFSDRAVIVSGNDAAAAASDAETSEESSSLIEASAHPETVVESAEDRPPESIPAETSVRPSASAESSTYPSNPTVTPVPTSTPTEDSATVAYDPEDIVDLTLVHGPNVTLYERSDAVLDMSGLAAEATWADGHKELVTSGFTFFPADTTGYYLLKVSFDRIVTYHEGTTPVYAYYGSKYVSFEITYKDAEDSPLWWQSAYSRDSFYVGEMTQACYSGFGIGCWLRATDNEHKVSPDQISFSPERLTTPGTQTIHASYGLHQASPLTVTVLPGSALIPNPSLFSTYTGGTDYIKSQCLPDEFHVGQTLTPSIVRTASKRKNYPELTDVIPAEEFSFSPAVLTKEGPEIVTVTCRGVSWKYLIWVGTGERWTQ